MEDLEQNQIVYKDKIDRSKIIYDLKELKPLLKYLYYSHRDFVRYGYRAHPEMTWTLCSKTLFMCHCETGNVWTHLLSALYFIFELVRILIGCEPYDKLTEFFTVI